ncbi:hypothetical protein C0992_009971 [Termitomyces sp. T32_za158]|nr:hypothetical protein C0992_009971 [Termitomyces sp. T32_za158]
MATNLLLTHLQKPNSTVPLGTIIAALAHHLSVDLPTPTPLAASAVSSPYFLAYPLTNERLQGLVTAFRHAVHLKHRALVKMENEGWSLSRAIFSKGVEGGMREWVKAVIRGLQGGRAVIRLACYTGLLSGVKDLIGAGYGRVEDEVVIALAEAMDDYNPNTSEWEKEFRPKIDGKARSYDRTRMDLMYNIRPPALFDFNLSVSIATFIAKGQAKSIAAVFSRRAFNFRNCQGISRRHVYEDKFGNFV